MIRARRPTVVLCAAVLSTAVFLWKAHVVLAATVAVQAASGDPGSTVDVCINMTDSGRQIAGVQMDLSWDGNCLVASLNEEGRPVCQANAATGKTVMSALLPGSSSLRAILFSPTDTRAIPDNIQLFCCSFTIFPTTSSSQCPIAISNALGGSVVRGGASGQIQLAAVPGQVLVNQAARRGGQRAPAGGPQVVQPPPVAVGGAQPGVPSGQGPRASGAAPAGLPAGGAPAPGAPAINEPSGVQAEPGEATPAETMIPPTAARTHAPKQGRTPARTPAAATPVVQTTKATARQTGTPQAHGTPSAVATPAAKAPTPRRKG
jgi:hypothetical protein